MKLAENMTKSILYHNQSLSKHLKMETYCSPISAITLSNLIYSIFIIILALIGTIGNTTVCYAVAKSAQLRKNVINWFIASLAVSDLLTCLVQFPMKITNSFYDHKFCLGLPYCYAYIVSDIWLCVSSISALFFISVCRYLAITRPTKYTVNISKNRANYMLALVWIQSAVWSGLSVLDWNTLQPSIHVINQYCLIENPIYYTLGYVMFIFLPLLITGVMYILAWKTLRQNNSRVAGGSHLEQIHHRREVKLTITLIIVYFAFILCWLPFCIYAIIGIWWPTCFSRLRAANKEAFFAIVLTFGNALPCLFPAINPFIYAICNPRYRAALVSVLRRGNDSNRAQYV